MELIEYLKTHDYNDLKKDNIKINTFKNLKLLKYNYNDKLDKEYLKYCKGCIINTDTNKVVCVPPKRSDVYNNQPIDNTFIIQDLIDGTMFNVFYTNNQWNISTRSDIGGHNKWSDKPFKQLIEEICKFDVLTSCLIEQYSYSFVLRHKSNKCISNIDFGAIVLVDIFDIENNIYIDDLANHFVKTIPFYTINNYTYKDVNRLMTIKIDHNWKGFIIKKNNIRYKYINSQYNKAKHLSTNSNNKLYTYIDCYQKKTIKKYLNIHPEYKNDFNTYQKNLDILINEIYNNYRDLKILKTIKFKDIPFQLKPLINEIHNEYIIKNKVIDNRYIKYYYMNLPIKRIVFIMNYYVS